MRLFTTTALALSLMLVFTPALPVLAMAAAPVGSAPATTAALPTDAETITANVEKYLNGLSTLRARFIQVSQGGDQVTGTFYLNRPGRMRFEYDAPLTDFIVADGRFIYYYDGQMKQQSNTLISQSLADFFLRKDLKLAGDVSVQDIRRDGGLLQVTIVQSSDPLAGSLTLGLSEEPMALKKWRVVDAQGLITEVSLLNATTGIKLDKELFHYYDPKAKNPSLNK